MNRLLRLHWITALLSPQEASVRVGQLGPCSSTMQCPFMKEGKADDICNVAVIQHSAKAPGRQTQATLLCVMFSEILIQGGLSVLSVQLSWV